MRRRDALKLSAYAAAAPFLGRAARAEPLQSAAAIVIGVDKPGDFPPLGGAASGARSVEKWLSGEGYDVRAFVDDKGPVKAEAVYEAIEKFVTPPTLDKLVIYFAGHGLYTSSTETWLLTNAVTNVQQAINLEECLKLARETGLKSIVFISDACRSNPESLRSARIAGSVVFPNLPPGQRPIRPEIDRFFAALPGRAALETKDAADEYYGVYTAALLDAFRLPPNDLVKALKGGSFIPNRMLKSYLQRAVPSRLFRRGILLSQQPDAIIESGDEMYLGHVSTSPYASSATSDSSSAEPFVGIRAAAQLALRQFGIDLVQPSAPPDALVATTAPPTDQTVFGSSAFARFRAIQQNLVRTPVPISFETGSGINIQNDFLTAVEAPPSMAIERVGQDRFPGALYRCNFTDRPGHSVVVRFATAGSAVLAVLRGYVLTVVVDETGIASISYSLSGGDDKELAELRATVAASTQAGAFRIEGDREHRKKRAIEIGDRIRAGKSMDPTLGIYAAYAYSDADILSEIISVRSYLKYDLGIDLFDIAMLSGSLREPSAVVPFCPMLSQGWNLLRVKGVALPGAVREVSDRRRNSLWTTFDAESFDTLRDAVRSGRPR
ncbi:caspase family protein [Methylobacterium radiotolerans]